MSDIGRGLPLLSGPPPSLDTSATASSCRKCNKEFVLLIVRHRKCNHCGYSFCHNCTDYQALMPRENGYDPMNVCGFCIEYLTITAAGRTHLKAMPMSKLRNYINAYNIQTVDRIVEKDDLIDAIVKARGPNGCLLPENEEYYRKHSIPDKVSSGRSRGLFSASRQGHVTTPHIPPKPPSRPSPLEFARPDLEPDNSPPPPPHPRRPYPNPLRPEPSPQRQQERTPPEQRHSAFWEQEYRSPPPPPPPRPHSTFSYGAPQFPPPQFHTPPTNPGHGWDSPDIASGSAPTPPLFTRPITQSTPRSGPPPPHPSTRPRPPSPSPPPTLDQLLAMPHDSIRTLTISVLKSILFTNHVNVTNILEKGDLVSKVLALVEDEKRDRERMRIVEEMERVERELEMGDRANDFSSSSTMRNGAGLSQLNEPDQEHLSDPIIEECGPTETETENRSSSNIGAQGKVKAPPVSVERNGLCVVCQDEEANIAIVDCGHLAMCRACSDLIMTSSKECPLCRTRIVTEGRLLRIFKA